MDYLFSTISLKNHLKGAVTPIKTFMPIYNAYFAIIGNIDKKLLTVYNFFLLLSLALPTQKRFKIRFLIFVILLRLRFEFLLNFYVPSNMLL